MKTFVLKQKAKASTKKDISQKNMSIETPIYELISKEDSFEIRSYSDMIIAKTNVQSDYKGSISTGFRRIASYIFGGNDKEMKIAMTAPVIAEYPSKDLSSYTVSFVMPKEHSLGGLPKANTELVSIEQENLGVVAVLSFRGWAADARSISYQKKLSEILENKKIKAQGGYMVAQFNSPWALPMFRKNELMVKIKNNK
jgi:hypothetical protein